MLLLQLHVHHKRLGGIYPRNLTLQEQQVQLPRRSNHSQLLHLQAVQQQQQRRRQPRQQQELVQQVFTQLPCNIYSSGPHYCRQQQAQQPQHLHQQQQVPSGIGQRQHMQLEVWLLLLVMVLVQQQQLQQSWVLQLVLFVLDAVQAVAMHLQQQQVRQALLLQTGKGVSKGRQQRMNRQHHPCHACLLSSSGSRSSSSIRRLHSNRQQQQEQQHMIRATQIIGSRPNSSRQEQPAAGANGA
jgi:hypothetical protein